jgi:hypothetical protein
MRGQHLTNTGLASLGTTEAKATVKLHHGAGALLVSNNVTLGAARWKQEENQPFVKHAQQTSLARGMGPAAG